MGENIAAFLTDLRHSYLKGIVRNAHVRIVCGNESADLDSVVSALSYAYFSFLHDPNKPIVPVLNIVRDDLSLRKDIVWALKQQNIPQSLLYFQEDVRDLKNQYDCKIEAILVDHNDVQSELRSLVDSVVGIIDHHKDVGLHKEIAETGVGPRIITKAGSCSSLVSNYWFKILGRGIMQPTPDVLQLCVGALLVDTSNMLYKVEQADLAALQSYKFKLGGFNFTTYFEQIHEAKNDLEGLSLRDILRKDYKEFEFPTSGKRIIKCGMASVVKPLEWLVDKNGADGLEKGYRSFLEERSQDILLTLTNLTSEGQFLRQIAFYAETPENIRLSEKLTHEVRDILRLKPINSKILATDKFSCFSQLNTAASRKQVAPYVQNAVGSL